MRATNPHSFSVDGVAFLGTSGQNIDDMAKYSRQSDRCACMGLHGRGQVAASLVLPGHAFSADPASALPPRSSALLNFQCLLAAFAKKILGMPSARSDPLILCYMCTGYPC